MSQVVFMYISTGFIRSRIDHKCTNVFGVEVGHVIGEWLMQ